MAAGALTFYEAASKNLVDTINLSTDSLKMLLLTSGYTPSVSGDAVLTDIDTNELSGANGYTRQTLTGVTLTEVAGVTTLDCADIEITFTGNETFKYAVFFSDTPTSPADPLIGYVDLDFDGGGSIEVNDGNTFKLVPNTLGLFKTQV